MDIGIVTTSGSRLKNEKKGKEYKLGFRNIPQSELESFEKASEYVHNSFDMDLSEDIIKVNEHLKNKDLKQITIFPADEQEKRKSIRNKALDSILKDKLEYLRYIDHSTEDPFLLRYTLADFMHHTPDEKADKEYNQRLTDLLTKAKKQKYADGKELNKEDAEEKNELLGHFREHLKKAEKIDFEKLLSKEWTDDELAENAGMIYSLDMLFADFNDIPRDLGLMGIKDQVCEDIINKYNKYQGFVRGLSRKLSTITSPTYSLYDPEKEPDFLSEISAEAFEGEGVSASYQDAARCYNGVIEARINSNCDTVVKLFNELGIPKDKVFIGNPEDPEKKKDLALIGLTMPKNGEVTFFCEDPKHSMTFNLKNEDFNKALLQNRLSELVEQTILTEPEPVPMPQKVAKPEEVGFLGKFADFFSNIFTGHKPRQEAYSKSMEKYNEYQTQQKKFDKFLEENERYLEFGPEKADKREVVASLKEKERIAKENIRQAEMAKEIKNQELGLKNIIAAGNKPAMNNNEAKEIIANELKENDPNVVKNDDAGLIKDDEKQEVHDMSDSAEYPLKLG